MNKPMLRREFLIAAGAGAAAAPISSGHVSAMPNAPEVSQTGNRARLLVGCCAYSYLRYFSAGSMTMESFIQKAVELGVHGVDITTYWLKSTEPEYLASLRHVAFKNGMSFSGIAIRTELCQAGGAIRAEEGRRMQRWIDACELLGASHVRVFGGSLPEGAAEKQDVFGYRSVRPVCNARAHSRCIWHDETADRSGSRVEAVRAGRIQRIHVRGIRGRRRFHDWRAEIAGKDQESLPQVFECLMRFVLN